MKISFEPGDGSFEITLQPGEVLSNRWRVPGVTVLRETQPGHFTVEETHPSTGDSKSPV